MIELEGTERQIQWAFWIRSGLMRVLSRDAQPARRRRSRQDEERAGGDRRDGTRRQRGSRAVDRILYHKGFESAVFYRHLCSWLKRGF